MPAGELVDWVIGISIFWWLSIIVTIPWNMHFTAKGILSEAAISTERGIPINEKHVAYARKLAKRFLILAIILHIVTVVGLYLLTYFQVTAIGYWASGAALLLTFLRPAQRAYDHLVHKLSTLSHEMRYPREDIFETHTRVVALEAKMNKVYTMLNTDEEDSWASKQEKAQKKVYDSVNQLRNAMEDLSLKNKREHELLARRSEEEMARLSEDAQFLNQVRDIIQFFKKA